MRLMNAVRTLLPMLVALLAAAAPAALRADGPEPVSGPRWYRLEIDGAPAGWALERIERSDGRVTTTTRTTLRLHRGATELELELASRFVETAGGEPVELWRRQTLGRLPMEATFRFRGDRIEATTTQAGRESAETLPLPRGEWLTPDAARRAALERRRSGETHYRLRTLDPFQGLEPVILERERLGPGTAPGAVDRWRERQLASRQGEEAEESVIELDTDGRLVASSTTFMGLELTLHATDRESAQSPGSGSSPELLVANFVQPDRTIADPRRLRRAVYELSLAPGPNGEPGTPPALPEGGAQRVIPLGPEDADSGAAPGRVRLEVDALGRLPPPPADADGARTVDPSRYLAASSYLDHRDPAVRAILGRREPPDRDPVPEADGQADGDAAPVSAGTPSTTDPRQRALALASLVHRRITTKTLDTGFATASEVARTGAGDCTEHAVLLAALLRAEGIPSRVVSGLVYLEEFAGAREVFGYHMWTQALIGGRWLDLDATLPPSAGSVGAVGSTGFDATHIALAISALDGPDAVADFLPLTPLIGKLRIRVLEAAH